MPNLKNTVDCLPVVTKPENVELLTKYKVYTEGELKSRQTILAENYIKTIDIEGQTALNMAKTMILPAALRYQREVGESINAAKDAGAGSPAGLESFGTLVSAITEFQSAITKLEKALHSHAEGDAFAHAKHYRDHVMTGMAELRKVGDKLETMVADDLWPLPTYREMLFIR